jgi:Zn-dependent M28 family amino/carboxypeptidase
MRPRFIVPLVVIVAIVVLVVGQAQAPRGTSSGSGPALDEIRAEQIEAHLRFLSHDLLEGRAPSTRGGQLAAEYLASQLAAIGYEPAGDNGTYFQNVPIVESVVDPSFTLIAGPGAAFKYLDDIVVFSGLQEPRIAVAGDLVFVGHGIIAPEYDWNDYEGVDMKGKVALVMVNDPPATAAEPQLFGGDALTYYGRWTYKFEEAARQGAAGAILIHTDASATYPWQVVQTSWSGTQYSLPAAPGQPALAMKAWVTENAAREIARRGGHDLDALRKTAATRDARPVPIGVQVSGAMSQNVQQKTSPNVIGVLRGTSGMQGVIYTAHYDHFGIREARPNDPPDADRIFNGAQDNAAGVSATLEVAQAFARARTRPTHSIYILFTTAEESGLLGADYFAAHPVLPASAWAANINIDGVNLFGKARDVVLLGSERSTLGTVADQLAKERGRVIGPDPEPGRGYFFRSDHFPLAKAGIPALSISDPVEYVGKDPGYAKTLREEFIAKDYHQPSDEFKEEWDYTGAVDDMRFLAELGWRVANSTTMPAYHANEQFARPRLK